MLPYSFYNYLHILGLILLFTGFGGLLIHQIGKVNLAGKAKMISFATHGLGLLLIFISGFGMAGKGGFMSQGWVHAKIAIWVLLALSISLIKRAPKLAMLSMLLVLILGGTAAYLAQYKPI